MPTSIPYDPRLVLGNIIEQDYFNSLSKIGHARAKVDVAESNLNELIFTRRSLDMTIQELVNLGVDPAPVQDQLKELNTTITEAATKYGKTQVDASKATQTIRLSFVGDTLEIDGVSSDEGTKTDNKVAMAPESPLDFQRSIIKPLPLSADSMKANVQYFSYDSNSQTAGSFVSQVTAFVSQEVGFLGTKHTSEARAATQSQMSSQVQNHDIEGTLVVSINCTHKNASLFAPLVLDVDKAIRVWNMIAEPKDRFDPSNPSDIVKVAVSASGDLKQQALLRIISGATFGSSFVGMVHVLKEENTRASQAMTSVAASLQAQAEAGNWLAKVKGGFGLDSSFAADIKNMFSSQNISSHVSLVTMGIIPSLKSNMVKIGVKEFADFDPAKMMEKLATLENATTAQKQSVAQAAAAARTGQQMIQIEGAQVQNTLSGLAEIDDGQNKMIDINSMMTALDDYVERANSGDVGVPINYYVREIRREELAQLWVAKYFPGEYLQVTSQEDEKGPTPKDGGGTGGDST